MSRKPKDFKKFPTNSIMNKVEYEIVANNIMTILARTENTFRPLCWGEYMSERMQDGDFSMGERRFFDVVIDNFKDAETAAKFSLAWIR